MQNLLEKKIGVFILEAKILGKLFSSITKKIVS